MVNESLDVNKMEYAQENTDLIDLPKLDKALYSDRNPYINEEIEINFE